MTRSRIALVIDYSLDYLGGAQSAFLDEARLLLDAGHDVTLVVPSRGKDADWAVDWRERGGAIIAVAASGTLPVVDLPIVRNTPGLRRRLASELRERGIEVVHVHSEFGLAAAAISVARRARIATVQTVHTFFWQAEVPGAVAPVAAGAVRGFARWLRGFESSRATLAPRALDSALRGLTLSIAQRVGVVVSPSAHQAERLRRAGVARVVVVPNALAPGVEPGEALTEAGSPLRIVWVGRLVPEKRIVEWIDAVRLAAEHLGPGALEVEIIGDGPLRTEAESRGAGAPIRFSGRLSRDEVHERMRAAHLVALTSDGFDNQPVTVVEALHARRGVVYVDAALTEGLDTAGLLAASPDPVGMAALLEELVADADRVVEVSRAAAEAARIFDPAAHVERLHAVYATALELAALGEPSATRR